jgi:hypothetical protein
MSPASLAFSAAFRDGRLVVTFHRSRMNFGAVEFFSIIIGTFDYCAAFFAADYMSANTDAVTVRRARNGEIMPAILSARSKSKSRTDSLLVDVTPVHDDLPRGKKLSFIMRLFQPRRSEFPPNALRARSRVFVWQTVSVAFFLYKHKRGFQNTRLRQHTVTRLPFSFYPYI